MLFRSKSFVLAAALLVAAFGSSEDAHAAKKKKPKHRARVQVENCSRPFDRQSFTPVTSTNGLVTALAASSTANVWMCNDIDLKKLSADLAGKLPLSYGSKGFGGYLEGNNKTILNLDLVRPNEEYVGFFRRIEKLPTTSGVVRNLTFRRARVVGKAHVGVLAGENAAATISNVRLWDGIKVSYRATNIGGDGTAPSSAMYLSALVGENRGRAAYGVYSPGSIHNIRVSNGTIVEGYSVVGD